MVAYARFCSLVMLQVKITTSIFFSRCDHLNKLHNELELIDQNGSSLSARGMLTIAIESTSASYGHIELHQSIHCMVVEPHGASDDNVMIILFKCEKRDGIRS